MAEVAAMLTDIVEIARHPSPGPEPLGLAFDGAILWITARETHRLYAIDPATWAVRAEYETPGAPFGIAVAKGQLRMVIGFGDDDDDRYIYRFAPGQGFDTERIACPDLSGVHLAFDGDTLYLSQAHNRKLLALDSSGAVTREIRLDRRPVGMTIVRGLFYLITADADWKDHQLATVDARGETPVVTALASIPFRWRGLAFDGFHFWTGFRDTQEIVEFEIPKT